LRTEDCIYLAVQTIPRKLMIRTKMHGLLVGRLAFNSLLALSIAALLVGPAISVPAHAQTQIVTATPGNVNLGMTTSITVTAPAAGTYTVVVQKPGGTSVTLPFTFGSSGQSQNATFGNSASGFKGVVDQVGTYNVFVEQGTQVVGSTSFYATKNLIVSMDMVNGGTCSYIPGATRGTKMFPRFYIYYASNNQPLTNATKGISVNFTMPDKTVAPAPWDSGAKLFVGKVQPSWNYTYIGPWSPTATISDAFGNTATYQYSGTPFDISPVQLSTSIQLVDAKTSQITTSLYNGQTVTIRATVTYPTNAEPVPGFVAPLDSSVRGGAVTALVGWGYYNVTAGTFGGSAKNPGALLGTVHLTYSGANGTWTGQYSVSSLPTIPAGATYAVAVTSTDKASPPNTGLGTLSLGLAGAPTASTTTATSAPAVTSTSTFTTTVSQVVQSIPDIVYAGMVVLLVVGLIIGLVLRIQK
jgi:hypothetical protein